MGAMLAMLTMQVASGGELTGLWEVTKGVMLTLTTAGVLWSGRTLFTLRDDVRDLKRDVSGTNGLKAEVADLTHRVDDIDQRHMRIDAVAEEAERQAYQGEERRHGQRRLRDKLREEDDRRTP